MYRPCFKTSVTAVMAYRMLFTQRWTKSNIKKRLVLCLLQLILQQRCRNVYYVLLCKNPRKLIVWTNLCNCYGLPGDAWVSARTERERWDGVVLDLYTFWIRFTGFISRKWETVNPLWVCKEDMDAQLMGGSIFVFKNTDIHTQLWANLIRVTH